MKEAGVVLKCRCAVDGRISRHLKARAMRILKMFRKKEWEDYNEKLNVMVVMFSR